MKSLLLILALEFAAGVHSSAGMMSFRSVQADTIPELNRQIVDFVTSKMKKKVGRGECWDLAATALNEADATWNGKLRYGKLLDPDKDVIYPGDIIQFEGVKLKFEKNGLKYTEVMKHHTAIVYSVIEPHRFQIAHQNTSQWGRKVGTSELNLDEIVKGKYFIYRPVR